MALLKALKEFMEMPLTATCQSGYGAVCKTVYPGSIPGVASNKVNDLVQGLKRQRAPRQRFVSRIARQPPARGEPAAFS
jgi:hypothetical protein